MKNPDFYIHVDNYGRSVTKQYLNEMEILAKGMDDILFLFIDTAQYLKHMFFDLNHSSLSYENVNIITTIEDINTQLDNFKRPYMALENRFIDSTFLIELAYAVKTHRIPTTLLMTIILRCVIQQKPSHIKFWDNVNNLTEQSFMEELNKFLYTDDFKELKYKYTMVNLASGKYTGYWEAKTSGFWAHDVLGVDRKDIDNAINNQAKAKTPKKIQNEIQNLLRKYNYSGKKNFRDIVLFLKSLGSASKHIIYQIPLFYTFPSTKYNDRLRNSFNVHNYKPMPIDTFHMKR